MKKVCLFFLFEVFVLRLYSQALPLSTIGEVYNFEVGDVFQYQESHYNYLGFQNVTASGYSMDEILDRLDSAGTRLIKTRHTHYYNIVSNFHASQDFGIDTFTQVYYNLDSTIFYNHDSISCPDPLTYCHIDSGYIDSAYCLKKGNAHFEGELYWSYVYYNFLDGLGYVSGGSFSEDYGVSQGSSRMSYFRKVSGGSCGGFYDFPVINSIEHIGQHIFALHIFPNPATSSFALQLSSAPSTETYFQLYDALGRQVKRESISATTTTINRNNLPSGIYFWQLVSANKVLERGKVVME